MFAPAPCGYTAFAGETRDGADIGIILAPGPDLTPCYEKCNSLPACTGFVHAILNSHCYLKNGSLGPGDRSAESDQDVHVRDSASCSQTTGLCFWAEEPGLNYTGTFFDIWRTRRLGWCLNLCANTALCEAVVYNFATTKCNMLHTLTGAFADNTTTYHKPCDPNIPVDSTTSDMTTTRAACPAYLPSSYDDGTECFWMGDMLMNFDDSLVHCAGLGGTLATLTEAQAVVVVNGLLDPTGVDKVWVNLRQRPNATALTSEWYWLNADGTETNLALGNGLDWKDNEPNDYSGSGSGTTVAEDGEQNVAVLIKVGVKLADKRPAETFRPLCVLLEETSLTWGPSSTTRGANCTSSAGSPPTQTGCWAQCSPVVADGLCYAMYATTGTREAGRDACQAGGGDLAAAASLEAQEAWINASFRGWVALLQRANSSNASSGWYWEWPGAVELGVNSSQIAWIPGPMDNDGLENNQRNAASIGNRGGSVVGIQDVSSSGSSRNTICMYKALVTTPEPPSTSQSTVTTTAEETTSTRTSTLLSSSSTITTIAKVLLPLTSTDIPTSTSSILATSQIASTSTTQTSTKIGSRAGQATINPSTTLSTSTQAATTLTTTLVPTSIPCTPTIGPFPNLTSCWSQCNPVTVCGFCFAEYASSVKVGAGKLYCEQSGGFLAVAPPEIFPVLLSNGLTGWVNAVQSSINNFSTKSLWEWQMPNGNKYAIAINYFGWAPGEPDDADDSENGQEDIGILGPSGMEDVMTAEKHNSICMYPSGANFALNCADTTTTTDTADTSTSTREAATTRSTTTTNTTPQKTSTRTTSATTSSCLATSGALPTAESCWAQCAAFVRGGRCYADTSGQNYEALEAAAYCAGAGGFLATLPNDADVAAAKAAGLGGWLSLFQDPDQSTPNASWYWEEPGGLRIPLTSTWAGGQPDDNSDDVEENEENQAILDGVGLRDKLPTSNHEALCMFDSIAVTTSATSEITTSVCSDTEASSPTMATCWSQCSPFVLYGRCYASTLADFEGGGDAAAYCTSAGGFLATLPTDADVDAARAAGLFGWLNLVQIENQGSPEDGWEWAEPDGSRVAFASPSKWKSGQPNDLRSGETGDEQQAGLESGGLRDYKPTHDAPALCMFGNATSTSSAAPSSIATTTHEEITSPDEPSSTTSSCLASGYPTYDNCWYTCNAVVVRNTCFATHSVQANWTDQWDYCVGSGGQLAVLDSPERMAAVRAASLHGFIAMEKVNFTAATPGSWFWRQRNGQVSVASTFYWGLGQPDNIGEDVVYLRSSGDFNDYFTYNRKEAICMFTRNVSTTTLAYSSFSTTLPTTSISTSAATTSIGLTSTPNLPVTTISCYLDAGASPNASSCWDQCSPIILGDYCFARYPIKVNFSEAESYCTNAGGYLGALRNDGDLLGISPLGLDLWLNLRQDAGQDEMNEGWRWYFPDGSSAPDGLTLWKAGEPDEAGGGVEEDVENYGKTSSVQISRLVDDKNTTKAYALCMFLPDGVTPMAASPTPEPSLATGNNCTQNAGASPTATSCWAQCSPLILGNYCFASRSTKVNFDTAVDYCTSAGGFLGAVRTDAELAAVAALDVGLWLNMRQDSGMSAKGEGWWWYFPDGTSVLNNLTCWKSSQPNDGGGSENDAQNYARTTTIVSARTKLIDTTTSTTTSSTTSTTSSTTSTTSTTTSTSSTTSTTSTSSTTSTTTSTSSTTSTTTSTSSTTSTTSTSSTTSTTSTTSGLSTTRTTSTISTTSTSSTTSTTSSTTPSTTTTFSTTSTTSTSATTLTTSTATTSTLSTTITTSTTSPTSSSSSTSLTTSTITSITPTTSSKLATLTSAPAITSTKSSSSSMPSTTTSSTITTTSTSSITPTTSSTTMTSSTTSTTKITSTTSTRSTTSSTTSSSLTTSATITTSTISSSSTISTSSTTSPNTSTSSTTSTTTTTSTSSTTSTTSTSSTAAPSSASFSSAIIGTTSLEVSSTSSSSIIMTPTGHALSTIYKTTTTPFPFEKCRTELNIHYRAGQIISNKSASIEECCRQCQLELKCSGYTYDQDNHTCFLMERMWGRQLQRGWTSGATKSAPFGESPATSSQCLVSEFMVSYIGGDLISIQNYTLGDCFDACVEHPDCVGYSLKLGNGTTDRGECQLKRPTKNTLPIFGVGFVSASLSATRNMSTTMPSTSVLATTNATEKVAKKPKNAPPEPMEPIMGETEQMVADTIQSIGCIWIVVATALTLLLCALFRNTTHERQIHISQEVSILISHIIILAHRDPKFSDYNWTICRLCALGLHYLQTVTIAAFLLEAVQLYAISTSVALSGGFFSRRANAVLAWGIPLILTGLTTPFIYYEYVSWFSCWINLDMMASKVVFTPLILTVAVTVIIWEAANSFRGQMLKVDRKQMITALLNRQGLPIVMSLYVACHATGSMAIHYQQVGIYGLVFVLNAIFGTAILFTHALSDQAIRSWVYKMLPCCK